MIIHDELIYQTETFELNEAENGASESIELADGSSNAPGTG